VSRGCARAREVKNRSPIGMVGLFLWGELGVIGRLGNPQWNKGDWFLGRERGRNKKRAFFDVKSSIEYILFIGILLMRCFLRGNKGSKRRYRAFL